MAETQQNIDGAPADNSKRRKLVSTLVAAGLILAEGAGIFIVTRMMYQRPATAAAAQKSPQEQAMASIEEQIEVALPEINAFNKREGRLFLYNLEVTVVVHKKCADNVKKVLDLRTSTILDRFNTVIRSADSKYLNEPGLDTLRRQFRFELDKVLGDDEVLLDLLIPRFYQSPADL
jgi:flagellar basal body-associated protein FliL